MKCNKGNIAMLKWVDRASHKLLHLIGINLGFTEAHLEGKYIVTYFVCSQCGKKDFIRRVKINGED